MADRFVLRDPLSNIPELELACFYGECFSRGIVSGKVSRFNRAGRPVITGPGAHYGFRFIWTMNLALNRDDALRFQRFWLGQEIRSHLVLDDELIELPPELTSRKTIIPGAETTLDGDQTGYGRFAVWLELPEDSPIALVGNAQDTEQYEIVATFYEIPEVTP